MMHPILLTPLLRAQKSFEQFRRHLKTDQEKAGAIQAFEYCYELAWKLLKKTLEQKGLEVGSPKDAFRQGAVNKLISDPEIWFEFQKKRNLTVHTYNEVIVEEIIQVFEKFSGELNALIHHLRGDL